MPVSVVAAVHDPAGETAATNRLRALTAQVGGGPKVIVARGDTAVAAWGPRAGAGTDEASAAAWIHGPPNGASEAWRERNGSMFGALAMASKDGLDLFRGPFGGRSLYYATLPGRVVVACSQLAPLVAVASPVSLDHDVLASFVVATPPHDPDATCYREIRRVGACETVRFCAGTKRTSVTLPATSSIRSAPPDELAEALVDQLARTIDRIVGPVSRIAVLGGGGVDSSGLLGTLVHRTRASRTARVSAVTFDFAGPGDDRPHFRTVTDSLGVEALRVYPSDASALVKETFVIDAAPFEWPTGALDLCAAERGRAWGADVLMSGTMGDGVLDGDYRRFARRICEGDLRAVVDAARFIDPFGLTPASRVEQLVLRPLIRRAIPPRLLRLRRSRAVRDYAAWGWGGDRVRAFLKNRLDAAPTEAESTRLATLPEVVKVADARAQIEVRVGCDRLDPYLDPGFLKFMASIPLDALFHGHRMRGLFCHAMRGIVPDSVRLRPDKASFEPAMAELVVGMGGISAFGPLLSMEATADLGLVNPRLFRAAFEAQVRGEASAFGWIDVWPAVVIESFVRGFSGTVARGASDGARLS